MNKLKHWFNKTENVFLVIAGLFGLISIVMNPILVVPDESTHLAFSYSMFSCNAHVPNFVHTAEDHIIVANDIKQHKYLQDFTNRLNLDGNCFAININDKKSDVVFGDKQLVDGSVVRHFANFPAAIGILIGRALWPTIGGMVLLGRITNFAMFMTAVYFIIKRVKFGKLVFLFLAITPMMIHQMASLSYDVFNLVTIFAFVAFCINLAVQKSKPSKKQYTYVAGLALMLLFSKPNNLLMMPLLLGIIAGKYQHPHLQKITNFVNSIKKRWGIAKYRILASSTILVLAVFIIAVLREAINVHRLKDTILSTLLYPNINGQIDPIATTGVVGNFGWLAYRFPEWIVILWFIVLTIILLADKVPKISKRISGLAFAVFLLVCASVFGALGYAQYIHGSNVLLGIQGRYFTPLLSLLILVFAGIQNDIRLDVDFKKLKTLTVLFSLSLLLIYLYQTKTYYYN